MNNDFIKNKFENQEKNILKIFENYYNKYKNGFKGIIEEEEIKEPDSIKKYSSLPKGDINHLKKVAVIKLNGGLGTSMGLNICKSLLKIKNDYSFLDLTINQILYYRKKYNTNIPLILMNSLTTKKQCEPLLNKYPELKIDNIPLYFIQNNFPRLNKKTKLPTKFENENKNWNPAGHGDIYSSLYNSGLLDTLIEKKYEYIFISNSDNLGAVIDNKILSYLINNKISFLMEVCKRTDNDKKGGHLAVNKNKKLILREIAQCKDDDLKYFMDINFHKFFNTNNLWVNLCSLKNFMNKNEGIMELPLIINPKTIENKEIVQLETAMGSAIELFENSKALEIERDRFIPVKTTNELLLIKSNIFDLSQDFTLKKNKDVKKIPKIDLDKKYYKNITDMEEKIIEIPNLKNCLSLKLKGNIHLKSKLDINGHLTIETDNKIIL